MNNGMGEVKIKITIINAGDEALFRRGNLSREQVRIAEVEAIVDTGATTSVLTPEVARQLGLQVTRQEPAIYANEYRELVDIAEPIVWVYDIRRCVEEPFVMGHEVLIGQIPLERMDLVVDCNRQQVIPNPMHPDGPVFRV